MLSIHLSCSHLYEFWWKPIFFLIELQEEVMIKFRVDSKYVLEKESM